MLVCIVFVVDIVVSIVWGFKRRTIKAAQIHKLPGIANENGQYYHLTIQPPVRLETKPGCGYSTYVCLYVYFLCYTMPMHYS